MAHTIRLRGAWTLERQPASAGGPHVIKLKRDFGYSSGLESASRVWLSISTVASKAFIELNGNALGRIDGRGDSNAKSDGRGLSRFDVTAYLKPRNTLTLQFALPELQPSERSDDEWADVRLEIEE